MAGLLSTFYTLLNIMIRRRLRLMTAFAVGAYGGRGDAARW
jgi:hypothetical protein